MKLTLARIPWMRLTVWAAVLVLLTAVLNRVLLPAYDFHGVYHPALRDLIAGHFSYATAPGYLNPPWALLLLVPLGVPEADVARAALMALTLSTMYAVMRDYRRFKVSFPLAVLSLPLLAVLWLGQLEIFALAGALIGYRAVQRRRAWWLSAALLLLAVKPQETWLIALWLLIVAARQWALPEWGKILGPALAVAVLTSGWLGTGWLTRFLGAPQEYAGQWQNFSLWRSGLNLSPVLRAAAWLGALLLTGYGLRRLGLTRAGLGLAAVSSNLLSPYLTNPQLLVALCLGWGALLDRSTGWGVLAYLAALTPLLRFVNTDQAWNQLDLLFPLVVWAGFIWIAWREKPVTG